uniref:COMM domain-containing protein n=1 Tax=Strongyloides venezuelensis TaxID=75913 RepID=A0A0K0FR10_STRVS
MSSNQKINIILNPDYSAKPNLPMGRFEFEAFMNVMKKVLSETMVDEETNIVIQQIHEENINKENIKKFQKILIKLFFSLKINSRLGSKDEKYKAYLYCMELYLFGKEINIISHEKLRSSITSKLYHCKTNNKPLFDEVWTKYDIEKMENYLKNNDNLLNMKETLKKEFYLKYKLENNKFQIKFQKITNFFKDAVENMNKNSFVGSFTCINVMLKELDLTDIQLSSNPFEVIEAERQKKVVVVKKEGKFHIYIRSIEFNCYEKQEDLLYNLCLLIGSTNLEANLPFSKLISIFGLFINAEASLFLGRKLIYTKQAVLMYNKYKNLFNF